MKRLLLIFTCVVVLSCSDRESEVSTDVNELREFINLPAKPLSVKWTQWSSGAGLLGPSDYAITAVIKLNEADFKALKKKYKLETAHYEDSNKDLVKDWFPQSVKNCVKDNGSFVSVVVWETPKEFEKSPLVNGYCFFTNNNEVFVYMFTT